MNHGEALDGDDDPEWLAVLHAFLQRWQQDRAVGGGADVTPYLAAWPAHAERLRREHAALLADASREEPTVAAGLRIGAYRIERELGRGGQAVVYLARDERLQRDVALKVLPRLGPSPVQQLRLQREALVAARLEDPGICAVYEIGRDGGFAFLAMRHVAGETLAARLDRARADVRAGADLEDALGWRRVVAWFAALADSLHRAHEAGVVHRDLKPGNVMLDADERPVLLDFGLALGDEDPQLTRTDEVFGTPAYAAPERLRGSALANDRRVDVWSLGVCLFEALATERPFQGASSAAICRAVIADEPPDVRGLRPGLPADLAAIVAVALEKDPVRRYQTAAAMARDLRAVLAGEPVLARRPGVLRRMGRWHRRHAAIAAAVWMALVAAVVVVAVQRAMLNEVTAARDEATRLGDFLVEKLLLAGTPREARGTVPTVPEVFTAAAKGIAETFREPSRTGGKLEHVLGVAFERIGRREDAARHLERALAIRTQVLGGEARATLETRFELSRVQRAADQIEVAERELRAVLAAQERRFGRGDRDAVRSRVDLALLRLDQRDDRTGAEHEAKLAAELARASLAPDDPLLDEVDEAWARCLSALGRRADAEPLQRRVLERCRQRHGDMSTQVVGALVELASLLHDRALDEGDVAVRWRAAAAAYEELLATASIVHPGDDKTRAIVLNNVATFWQHRADLLPEGPMQRAGYARAETLFCDSIDIRERLDGPDSARVATAIGNLATLLCDMGNTDEGLALLQRARAIKEKLYGPDHIEVVKVLNNLGMATLYAAGADAALPLFTQARTRLTARNDRDPRYALIVEEAWLTTRLMTAERRDCLPAIEDFYPRLVAWKGEHSPKTRWYADHAARLLREQGRLDELPVWEQRAAEKAAGPR